MKKFPFVTIFLICLVAIMSCADEKSSALFNEVNITTDSNEIVDIYIPRAIGDNLVSEKINTKIDALIMASLNVGDSETNPPATLDESINNFNKEYLNFQAQFPESPMVWEAQIDGELSYLSDAIISIAITNYQNTGGAHGNLVISFLNFDRNTGDIISNHNLFSNLNAFQDIARTYFFNEIADKKENYFDPNNFALPENIGFDDDGLILLYNTYEIAPYSSGLTEIHIPFDEIDSLLTFK